MKPVTRVRHLMSISHAEFLHSLVPLGRHYPYRIDATGSTIHLTDGSRRVEIRLGPEGRKRFGSLELPETLVEFHFESDDAEAVERFFSRFDICFRRGGG